MDSNSYYENSAGNPPCEGGNNNNFMYPRGIPQSPDYSFYTPRERSNSPEFNVQPSHPRRRRNLVLVS